MEDRADRPCGAPERRRLGAALAVATLALVAAVIVGVAADWRAVAALPAVIAAVPSLVRAVLGEERRTAPPGTV